MASAPPTTPRGRWLLRGMIAAVVLLVLLGLAVPWLRMRRAAAQVSRYHARVWYGPSGSPSLDEFTAARQWDRAGSVVAVYRDMAIPLARPETEEFVRLLPYFPRLQSLDLSHTELVDADFEVIGRMRELSLLILYGSPVEGRNLDHLSGCRSLTALQLLQVHCDQNLLDAVGRLPQLERLNLTGTRLTDLDLSPLARMPNLKVLILDSTELSDTQMLELSGLKQLEELSLSGNNVSEEAVSRLRARVPIHNYSDD